MTTQIYILKHREAFLPDNKGARIPAVWTVKAQAGQYAEGALEGNGPTPNEAMLDLLQQTSKQADALIAAVCGG